MNNTICSECGGAKSRRSKMCSKCRERYYKTRKTKVCSKCKEELPIELFGGYTCGEKNRPRSRCKKCEAVDNVKYRKLIPAEEKKRRKKKYYHNNLEKVRKYSRKQSVKKKGLDVKFIENYISNHKGKCEICGKDDNHQSLSVDHCHTNNVFRGLLCSKCNMGIGMFQDNIELLEEAIKYLNRKPVLNESVDNDNR